MEDIESNRPACEELERLLLIVHDIITSEVERKQMKTEFVNAISQFHRIEKTSIECLNFLEEIEPIAKELADNVKPVEALNSEMRAVLGEKQVVAVDLELLESEINYIEVRSIFHPIYCVPQKIMPRLCGCCGGAVISIFSVFTHLHR